MAITTTPTFGFPYPAPTDPPDGAGGLYGVAAAGENLPKKLAGMFVEVTLTNALSMPTDTWVDVPYNVEVSDTYNMWNGSNFTLPWDGRYSVLATQGIGTTNMPAASRLLAEFYSGSIGPAGGVIGVTAPVVDTAFVYHREFTGLTGQTCKMHIQQTSGASRFISNDPSVTPHLILRFLG